MVRAVTLLVAPELAAALRDQPAAEEATAWAAVALAVEDAAEAAAEEAEADAGDRPTIERAKKAAMKRTARAAKAPADAAKRIAPEGDELLYEPHLIATGGLPFSKLKQRSRIK